ncbi:MAG: magnesium transporter [Chloroherpetonaceae bacterium]|nr:magnesium transporter [Chloroherpetonaceae bacterium]
MLGATILPEIRELIETRKFTELREVFSEMLPADIAEILVEIPEKDQAVVFRLLPHALATDVFEFLDFDSQKNLIKALGKEEVAAILDDMSEDDRTALLEELPAAAVKQMLSLLSPEERATAQSLLGYPPHSVGRLMTTDYIDVPPDWTVKQVLDHIRENGRDSETLNVIYVTDDKGRLIDDIKIREFLLAPLDKPVSELMNRQFVALSVTDDQATAAEMFKKYGRVALPVVDGNGILVGIVTVDDVLAVIEQEETKDFLSLGGVQTAAAERTYFDSPLWFVVRNRIGWLLFLFVGGTLTGNVVKFFHESISEAIAAALAIFTPLLIGTGGNTGSQTVSTIIRSLAIGEIELGDWFKVLLRETMTGATVGLLLGAIGFAWSYLTLNDWHFSAIVGGSVVAICVWSSAVASQIPIVAERLGLDPTVLSAPLITTLVDATGLVIYFSIAKLVFHLY